MFGFFQLILCLHIGSVFCTEKYFETYFTVPDRNSRNAINMEQFKWPNGIVHFVFDSSYNTKDRIVVLNAMRLIAEETCVKFIIKSPSQTEHIRFVKSQNGECGSNIGYRPDRREPLDVTFTGDCLKIRGAVQHELLHVLGLLHEQCRPDRDDFIEILWDNIDSRFHRNFVKGDYSTLTTFGLPYDYDSLMHYPGNAFAMPGKNVTMVSRENLIIRSGDKQIFPQMRNVKHHGKFFFNTFRCQPSCKESTADFVTEMESCTKALNVTDDNTKMIRAMLRKTTFDGWCNLKYQGLVTHSDYLD